MIKSSYVTKRITPTTIALSTVKILSNANRFVILKLLLRNKKDLCVHELAEAAGISQSDASHQLAYLEARGVVTSIRTGKTKCYMLANSFITKKITGVMKLLI